MTRKRKRWVVGTAGAVFLVIGLAWGLGGRRLGAKARAALSLCRAVLDSPSIESDGSFTNVVFLHHSTGRNLIEQGQVRSQLTEAGLQFWDHDYNLEGLTRPDGTRAGYSYNVPDDNTDPDGLVALFEQRVYDLPVNTFSGLLQHEVVVFKSCFPTSHIPSDDRLETYKRYYLGMRDVMDQHRDKAFIAVTPPPLNPASTNAEAAARARAFSDWMVSDEYLAGHPNVFAFDLFDLLAEGDALAPDYNMLRAEYREGEDSHPNQLANQAISPLFSDSVVQAAQAYREELAGGEGP